MAVRLDLILDPGPGQRDVGFVAASDADEDQLLRLLDRFERAGALSGATNHGPAAAGSAVRPADATTAGVQAATWEFPTVAERAWRDVICWALEHAAVLDLALAWETRYDVGGSVDAGSDEWQTSWSDAPTEGDGVDTTWPGPPAAD